MAAQDPSLDINLRVGRLEWKVPEVEDRGRKNSERLQAVERQQSVNSEIIRAVSVDVTELKATLDKLVWAIVGLALTIAGSVVIFAATGAGH